MCVRERCVYADAAFLPCLCIRRGSTPTSIRDHTAQRHSPQRVLELPRTRTESGHAGFPSAAPYERRAASAAILAAAALAIAAAVAARLSLAADNAAASAASAEASAASAATYSPQCVSA